MISKQSSLLLGGVTAAFLLTGVAKAALPPSRATSADVVPPAMAKLVSDGEKAARDGNFPLAVIQFRNAASALPRNANIRAKLGAALLQSGDYPGAERELRQARRDGAPDQIVLAPLFQVMLFRHEEKSILEEFSESVANRNPAMAADIYKAHALALQNLGQAGDAVTAMEKSLRLRRDAPGLLTRARIAQQQGDVAAATVLVNQAAELAPTDFNMLLLRFSLLIQSNNLKAAQALSDEVIAKYPESLSARLSRVEVLIQMGQLAKARKEIDVVIAKHPLGSAALYYRALIFEKSGDSRAAWENALALPQQFLQSAPAIAVTVSQIAVRAGAAHTGAAILDAAIGTFPRDKTLRLRLAAIRLRENNATGALNALEPIRDLLDAASAEILAKLYVRTGKRYEALALLDKLDREGKGSPFTSLLAVGLEVQQGQSVSALQRLLQASAQYPNDAVLAAQLVEVLLDKRQFAEALAIADRLGADSAQRPAALGLRGQILLAKGDPDGALLSYRKALALEPTSPANLYGRASVFEAMRRYPDASRDIRAVLARDVKEMPAYLKLAELAAYQEQDREVRSILSEAIRQVPQSETPRFALVRYLLERKDYKAAVTIAGQLVKMRPANSDALSLLGQAQMDAGQKREAVATFRRLAQNAPRNAAAQLLLGNALFATGDRIGAGAALKKAVILDRASAQVRASQIDILISIRNFEGAIESARAFQALNPGNAADILLGDTLARSGRPEQALAIYRKSFATAANGIALLRIVRSQIETGDSKSALDALSSWLTKNEDDTAIRVQYATLLMGTGRTTEAVKEYRIVLSNDPNNVSALNNLAWLLQSDDLPQALSLVTRAVNLEPNNPDLLDTLGWLKLQQKQVSDSVSLLGRAHKLRPDDGQISYHLVLALNRSGQRQQARTLLNALLASKVQFGDLQEAQKLSVNLH